MNELDILKREKRICGLAVSRIQTRINELLKKQPSNELVNLLDIELSDFRAERIKFEEVQKKILPILLEEADEKTKEEDIEAEWYMETDKIRVQTAILSSKIVTMKQSLEPANARESILNSTMTENPEFNAIKLPKIEIPTFSGDIRHWHDFQNLYKNLVHDNTNLSNVQRLYYLKNAMKGSASELIRDFNITDANYLEAWNTLCSRYDNKRATIKAHLRDFFNLQKIKNEREIRNLLDTVAKSLRSLKALGEHVDHWSAVATYWVASKLDEKTERDWETSITDVTKFPTFKELRTFLSARASVIEDTTMYKKFEKNEVKNEKPEIKKSENKNKTSFLAAKVKCYTCGNNHYLTECEAFKKKTPEQRYETIKTNKLCVNCFCKKHATIECRGPKCKICDRKHHYLLHRTQPEGENRVAVPTSAPVNAKDDQGKICLHAEKVSGNVILPTAVVYAEIENKRVLTRVILDSCSQTNLVSESLIKRLKLPVSKSGEIIAGIGEGLLVSKFSSSLPRLTSRIRKERQFKNINFDVVPYVPYVAPMKEIKCIQQVLNVEEPAEIEFLDGKVEILLGAEYFEHCLLDDRQLYGKIAIRNTIFGRTILGQVSEKLKLNIPPSRLCFLGIDETLKQFWKLEEVGELKENEDDERLCLEHFEATYTRKADGRFVIRLPFKENRKKLPALYHRASNALIRIENRCSPSLKENINQFMREYEKLGHMKKADKEIEKRDYFIPYQVVLRPTSTTTKVRIVFNASAKTKEQPSLNDILLKGPQLQPDLTSTLIRFREHKYVFTADIKMMYRQIQVHTDDQDVQKILWRYEKNDPLEEYRLTTLTYGTTPASFIATKCLNVLAEEIKSKNPQVAEIITKDFYMDDLMTGSDTLEKAIELRKEIQKVLDGGCFSLRKYVSNSKKLLKTIDSDLVLNSNEITFDGENEVLVLGIAWTPESDKIQIRLNRADPLNVVTKRSMLSELSRVFDPLGILAPATIRGKLLLQRLWKHQLPWDDPIPETLKAPLLDYRDQLDEIKNVYINRRYCNHSKKCETYLCGFSDASDKAYAAVVYVKCCNSENIQSYFACAKTRVAPIREITVPKLELCGALLLAELINKISSNLKVPSSNVSCFTDSTIVLSWLRKKPEELKIFVGNRTKKILKLVDQKNWNFVKSNENPADLATRGTKIKEIKSKFWLEGPKWLNEINSSECSKEQLKINVIKDSLLPELRIKKPIVLCNISENNNEILKIINKTSSYNKLLRIIGFVIKFIKNCKTKNKTKSKKTNLILNNEDLERSFVIIIKTVQNHYFQKEKLALNSKKEISSKSSIYSYYPKLDEKGVIRVGGRLLNANCSFERKYPILIPINCNFANMYLHYVHYKFYHASLAFMTNFVAQKFRFVGGIRNAARKIIRSCASCQRYSKQNASQLMGQLPADRVTVQRPFAVVGVDFAGPIISKPVGHRSKVRFKTYIAVFICYCIKAVHLEVVSDQTTSAFLASLKRFCARRGYPSVIYSDNAKNFVGAYNLLVGQDANKYLLENGVTWKFNPPRAPHHGGMFEAAVRIMKSHMKRTIGEQVLTFEELTTLTSEIEAIMNSRPLCLKDSNDVNDYLTPGHFLTGTHQLTVPERENIPLKLKERWKLLENLKKSFWRSWRNDYLNSFQKFSKWNHAKKNIAIDDIVFIKEDNEPPARYKLGKVVKTFPGPDQKVRVVELKTQNGTFLRPITKLVPFIASTGGNMCKD